MPRRDENFSFGQPTLEDSLLPSGFSSDSLKPGSRCARRDISTISIDVNFLKTNKAKKPPAMQPYSSQICTQCSCSNNDDRTHNYDDADDDDEDGGDESDFEVAGQAASHRSNKDYKEKKASNAAKGAVLGQERKIVQVNTNELQSHID